MDAELSCDVSLTILVSSKFPKPHQRICSTGNSGTWETLDSPFYNLPQWDARFGDWQFDIDMPLIFDTRLKNYGFYYQCHANLHDKVWNWCSCQY